MSARHVRKGDTVMVTSGDYKGMTGEILRVIPKHDAVVVKGVGMAVKNIKRTQQTPQGGQVTRETPIHISKVSPVVDGKPTRVRFQTKKDGTKVRIAANGGKELGVLFKPSKK